MIAVIQRVSESSVRIDGKVKSEIGTGLLVLLGIEEADGREDIEWLAKKIVNLRIFPDEQEVMNKSLLDVGGELLLVSQFTLHASTKKGNRPSYIKAARPEIALPLYELAITVFEAELGKAIGTGSFGADMKVSLINVDPVPIHMAPKNKV